MALPLIFGAIGAAGALTGMGVQIAQAVKGPPEQPGPTGAQRQLAGIQADIAANIYEQRGLSAQQVQRISQIGEQQRAQEIAAFSSMQNLSPFDKKRLADALAAKMAESKGLISEKIAALDPVADIKAQEAASKAAARASMAQNAIQKAEAKKQYIEDRMRQQQLASVGKSIQGVAKGLGGFFTQLEKAGYLGGEPAPAPETPVKLDAAIPESPKTLDERAALLHVGDAHDYGFPTDEEFIKTKREQIADIKFDEDVQKAIYGWGE